MGAFPGAWWLRLGLWADNGVSEELEMLPGKSTLAQNYPNPFNPSTTISFYNNLTGDVKLTVLNAKGEHVATLVNNNVKAGNHSVNFDGSKLNSGVYFYKLVTPTSTVTKKMLLVK
jgi:flagellar hook assembly protein FlgD